MGELGDFEQVAGQTAHELARAVAVIEAVAQTLHMAKQILPDVRLHADAKGVAPVADNII